jgi:hypothetical protein
VEGARREAEALLAAGRIEEADSALTRGLGAYPEDPVMLGSR